MGCGYSQSFITLTRTKQYKQWDRVFRALQISTSEVYEFYRAFEKADLDHAGSLDIVELLTLIDLERTPFTERIFKLFDEDSSGRINFFEFVLSLWNYCTLTKITLAMFAFDLYDVRSTGYLEKKDLDFMFHEVYGSESATLRSARHDLEHDITAHHGGKINLDDFVRLMETHQSLLFPAFKVQFNLRESICGVSFWDSCARRRVEISKGRYMAIKDIIELESIHQPSNLLKKGNSLDTKDAHLAAMNLGNAHNRRLKYSFDKTAEDEKKEKEDDKHHHVEHLHENPEGHHPERKKSLDNKNYPIATDVVQVPVLEHARHPSIVQPPRDVIIKAPTDEELLAGLPHHHNNPHQRRRSKQGQESFSAVETIPDHRGDFDLMDKMISEDLKSKSHDHQNLSKQHSAHIKEIPYPENGVESLPPQSGERRRGSRSQAVTNEENASFHQSQHAPAGFRRGSKPNVTEDGLTSHGKGSVSQVPSEEAPQSSAQRRGSKPTVLVGNVTEDVPQRRRGSRSELHPEEGSIPHGPRSSFSNPIREDALVNPPSSEERRRGSKEGLLDEHVHPVIHEKKSSLHEFNPKDLNDKAEYKPNFAKSHEYELEH